MAYQLPWLLISAVMFLVPNSQAVISDKTDMDAHITSYSCRLGYDTKKVSIHYGEAPQGLPCQVSLQQKDQPITLLFEAKRNSSACEEKAKDMTARLLDRGWSCQEDAI